jgi:hypothetical protein
LPCLVAFDYPAGWHWLDRSAVEFAGPKLIEVRVDQPRDSASRQGLIEGLLGADKAGAHRDLDADVRELRAESASLRFASGGQHRSVTRIAVDYAGDIRGGLSLALGLGGRASGSATRAIRG